MLLKGAFLLVNHEREVMGPLQLGVTWYRVRHAGEQVAHQDIQNKVTSSSQT